MGSFNPSIPQASDPLLQSQRQIRSNFQAINAVWSKNHFSLTGDEDFQGMHTSLNMRPTTDPTTDTTHIAIYQKLVSSIPQLFYRPTSNATPIQLTGPLPITGLNPTTKEYYVQQTSFLAGPFVIYAGFLPAATSGQNVALSPTTNLLYVGVTGANIPAVVYSANAVPIATSINSTMGSFVVNLTGFGTGITSMDLYYLAVGK